MNQADTPFQALRSSADEAAVAAIEQLVREAPDHALYRTNALAFAAQNGLDEERVIAAFLHAARLGLFELSWNVLCPGCGGVLDAGTTLKSVNRAEYSCAPAPPDTSRPSTRWSRSPSRSARGCAGSPVTILTACPCGTIAVRSSGLGSRSPGRPQGDHGRYHPRGHGASVRREA